MTELTEALIADLQSIDTPTVCNALELLVPERRGYGFTTQPLVCTRPELPPMVGVARTATIRSAHPSHLKGAAAREVNDGYYTYIDDGPKPSVVLIQDLDDAQRGYGSYWGEVNSNVHKGLGALGVITDGSV
ncbi:MAG: regulator of RNase E activity RraA, partial [Candidatus Azotimanducaceae bacterium]